MKTMTVRLSSELASKLEALARADGMTVSDVIRVAIDRHIESRRQDPVFQELLKDWAAEQRAVAERLMRP